MKILLHSIPQRRRVLDTPASQHQIEIMIDRLRS